MTNKAPDRLTKASENLRIQFQRAGEPKNDKKDLVRAIHEFVDAKIETAELAALAALRAQLDATRKALNNTDWSDGRRIHEATIALESLQDQ